MTDPINVTEVPIGIGSPLIVATIAIYCPAETFNVPLTEAYVGPGALAHVNVKLEGELNGVAEGAIVPTINLIVMIVDPFIKLEDDKSYPPESLVIFISLGAIV